MRASPSSFDDDELRLLGRRAWVKSAVLTAASTMPSGRPHVLK
jgi:hypothetical protein